MTHFDESKVNRGAKGTSVGGKFQHIEKSEQEGSLPSEEPPRFDPQDWPNETVFTYTTDDGEREHGYVKHPYDTFHDRSGGLAFRCSRSDAHPQLLSDAEVATAVVVDGTFEPHSPYDGKHPKHLEGYPDGDVVWVNRFPYIRVGAVFDAEKALDEATYDVWDNYMKASSAQHNFDDAVKHVTAYLPHQPRLEGETDRARHVLIKTYSGERIWHAADEPDALALHRRHMPVTNGDDFERDAVFTKHDIGPCTCP